MVIFFGVFFLVFGLLNYYIYLRASQSIPNNHSQKILFAVIFVFVSTSYLTGKGFQKLGYTTPADSLIWIGSYWFAFMALFIVSIILLDLLRLFNHIFHISPLWIIQNYLLTKKIAACVVIVFSLGLIIYGSFNANNIKLKKLQINISKHAGEMTHPLIPSQEGNKNLNELRIAYASDLHLGAIGSRERLTQIVNLINSINPDIVLLGGDITDERPEPVIAYNMGEEFKKIKSKYGIFAITGNHEYIGHAESSIAYLQKCGVRYLRDEAITIDKCFHLVGREDLSARMFAGIIRKPLDKLLQGLDNSKPVILMDHQPVGLADARNHNIDLQLSGHTHHGQLFPINLFTSMIYDIDWGYKLISGTHYYVSCGCGIWGPPVRIGSTPEVVEILVKFRD
ncbi:MAG: metallophosphoesterase [Ignavibacteria bacterium]|nr:metallophosphoesterase [Ignavibacteria bacterium]